MVIISIIGNKIKIQYSNISFLSLYLNFSRIYTMHRLISVWMSILLYALYVQCDPPTIRQTTNGPIEGLERTSSLGQKYYSFLGVPFAEPPITGTDPYTGKQVDRRFKVDDRMIIRICATTLTHRSIIGSFVGNCRA